MAHDNKMLGVLLINGEHVTLAGTIDPQIKHFCYEKAYLESMKGTALSLSLPLTNRPYEEPEFKPYFEGLLPEGEARHALAAQLGAREEDYLTLLCGILDCIGDIAVVELPEGEKNWEDLLSLAHYEPISLSDISCSLTSSERVAQASLASRLSLTGTQHKLGLARMFDDKKTLTWLRPLDGAASTHILKAGQITRIPELEMLALSAARSCRIKVASAELIELQPGNIAICVERFDRQISKDANKKLTVLRRHQEDFSQALRLSSGSKYAELEPSSAKVIAELLKQHSARPLDDIRMFAHIALFNYLIGNCDNHLKNFSLIHEGKWVRLSPAYDLVPTAIFPRFSREMGMNIGTHRNIDEINSRDFSLFANELSISPNLLRKLAKKMIHTLPSAIMVEAYKQEALGFETLSYDAEDLVDDLQTRLHVLESFVEG